MTLRDEVLLLQDEKFYELFGMIDDTEPITDYVLDTISIALRRQGDFESEYVFDTIVRSLLANLSEKESLLHLKNFLVKDESLINGILFKLPEISHDDPVCFDGATIIG